MKTHSTIFFSPIKYHKQHMTCPRVNDFHERLQKCFIDIDCNLQEKASHIEKFKSPILKLGVISSDHPTVSDLIIKDPDYRNQCWQIIHSKENKTKPFTKIQSGTEIFINPETFEIVWENNGYESYHIVCESKGNLLSSHEGQSNDAFSEKFADAVSSFIGRSYNEIDCYELIVNGLKKMGVRYYGDGGLKEKMIKQAEENGFAENAFLTGEGLIKTTGQTLYEKFIPVHSNSVKMMQEVFQSLEPILKRGQVLSFSTPTRGHTGIVSGDRNLWTYINSGRQDHHIGEIFTSNGVGEESLSGELKNWFKLAIERQEPLQITLGRLDEKKLVMRPKQSMRSLGSV